MRSFIAALLLAGAVLLAATGPADAGRNRLTIGITQFPSTFHPNIDAMLAKRYILAMTRKAITIYDPNWILVCQLCATLPTIENGLAVPETTPDGKPGIAVTYTLHPDARWGDGTPVSTDDVVFTWEVGRHPRTGVGNIELYRSIQKIAVKDAKTFTMHFDKLTFEYNAINDFDLLPAHLDRAKFEANPEDYRNTTTFDTDVTNPGLYFGPYRITKVERGSAVVLEPNPTWYGPKPAFQSVVVRVIENTAALEANLLSGNLDMISGELGLEIDQALAFEKRHGKTYNVFYKPGLIYEHIDLNLDNPILADIRVRHALIQAIDREAISQRLFEGRQPVAHASVNPLDWVYSPTTPKWTYDPKAAAGLLDAAGWKTKRKGIRHNAKGEPLTLEIMTTSSSRTRALVQQVLQSQWKQVGIDVRIKNQPPRVLFGETLTQRKFSAMIMYAWLSAPENVPRTTLHSDHVPTPENNFAGQNYTNYQNPEMDSLVEAMEVELDREKREKMWHRLQEMYATDLPVIPLYFRAEPYVLPKWLSGVEPTGHQYPTTYWIEDWRVVP